MFSVYLHFTKFIVPLDIWFHLPKFQTFFMRVDNVFFFENNKVFHLGT